MDISELVGIHSIGHGLTNVKVEFNNDLKLNVSDISIEGKKGEILNIPRWVADVLQSEKHVEIKDSETLVELKQAAMKEEVHGDFDLITLEPHFYIKIKSYMIRLPEKDYVKVEMSRLVKDVHVCSRMFTLFQRVLRLFKYVRACVII